MPAAGAVGTGPAELDAPAIFKPHENQRYTPTGQTTLSVVDILMLVGLRRHYMYWGPPDEKRETNCFGGIVRSLHRNDALLQ